MGLNILAIHSTDPALKWVNVQAPPA
jgi:hypothetical protein